MYKRKTTTVKRNSLNFNIRDGLIKPTWKAKQPCIGIRRLCETVCEDSLSHLSTSHCLPACARSVIQICAKDPFPASFTFSPFCLGLRLIPPFCGFASPFFSSCFVFGCLVDPFWTGWGGGIGEGEVELVVGEEERGVEGQHGVFGFGLWRGEATWLVKWVRSLSCTGFDVAHEARRGEPSCVHKIHFFNQPQNRNYHQISSIIFSIIFLLALLWEH